PKEKPPERYALVGVPFRRHSSSSKENDENAGFMLSSKRSHHGSLDILPVKPNTTLKQSEVQYHFYRISARKFPV
ncbi:hypothetical protein, partial [Sphingobacterium suaedae]